MTTTLHRETLIELLRLAREDANTYEKECHEGNAKLSDWQHGYLSALNDNIIFLKEAAEEAR